MTTEQGRLVTGGMGGAFDPPGHPHHTMHVETGPKRDPNSMSLECAAGDESADWLHDGIEAQANARLIAASPKLLDYVAMRASLGDADAITLLQEVGLAESNQTEGAVS